MADEEQAATPETPEPTLEEIASQFNEPQQTQPAQRSAAIQAPKFEDPNDFQTWASTQLAEVTSNLNETKKELNERKAAEFIKTQDEAVSSAVKEIQASVDIPELFAEGTLHVKYARDPNFKKIFDNREQNPAAYKRALGVIATELKANAQWKSDPQAEENTRALRELQKSSGKRAPRESANDKYKSMSDADFAREWERLKSG